MAQNIPATKVVPFLLKRTGLSSEEIGLRLNKSEGWAQSLKYGARNSQLETVLMTAELADLRLVLDNGEGEQLVVTSDECEGEGTVAPIELTQFLMEATGLPLRRISVQLGKSDSWCYSLRDKPRVPKIETVCQLAALGPWSVALASRNGRVLRIIVSSQPARKQAPQKSGVPVSPQRRQQVALRAKGPLSALDAAVYLRDCTGLSSAKLSRAVGRAESWAGITCLPNRDSKVRILIELARVSGREICLVYSDGSVFDTLGLPGEDGDVVTADKAIAAMRTLAGTIVVQGAADSKNASDPSVTQLCEAAEDAGLHVAVRETATGEVRFLEASPLDAPAMQARLGAPREPAQPEQPVQPPTDDSARSPRFSRRGRSPAIEFFRFISGHALPHGACGCSGKHGRVPKELKREPGPAGLRFERGDWDGQRRRPLGWSSGRERDPGHPRCS